MKYVFIGLFFAATFASASVSAQTSQPPGPAVGNPPQQSVTFRVGVVPTTRIRGYSLVLLLADTQPAPLPAGLSAEAKKAIADLKDFVPYKGYVVLDTQWLAATESGTSAKASGDLRGVGDVRMPFTLETSQSTQKLLLFAVGGRAVALENTFTAKPGETVVVGTSRLDREKAGQPDRALVVLFSVVEVTP